jgi:ribosome-dependent ATPase
MVVFGFGISTDVNNLTFAVMDHDHSHESRAYLEELRGSAYFTEQPPLANYGDLEKRLKSGEIKAGIEIPPGFTRPGRRNVRFGSARGSTEPCLIAPRPFAAIWRPCTSFI